MGQDQRIRVPRGVRAPPHFKVWGRDTLAGVYLETTVIRVVLMVFLLLTPSTTQGVRAESPTLDGIYCKFGCLCSDIVYVNHVSGSVLV